MTNIPPVVQEADASSQQAAASEDGLSTERVNIISSMEIEQPPDRKNPKRCGGCCTIC